MKYTSERYLSTYLHENGKTESGKKLKAEALSKMSIHAAASTTQVESNSNVNNHFFKRFCLVETSEIKTVINQADLFKHIVK